MQTYFDAIRALSAADWVGMGAFVLVVAALLWLADKAILWHDKRLPWRGLMK